MLNDALLANAAAGATAIAVVLGSPNTTSATFSVVFSEAITTTTFFSTGFLGQASYDLLSIAGSSATATVTSSATPLPTGGYANTGNPAFGVHAEYKEDVDAVQIIIGLNQDAIPQTFTGSATLLTGSSEPMDQILFDQSYVLVSDDPILCVVFLHPKTWAGLLVGVTIDIGGTSYMTEVPVASLGAVPITGQLTQQPARWYHPRLVQNTGSTGSESFGPGAITGTP